MDQKIEGWGGDELEYALDRYELAGKKDIGYRAVKRCMDVVCSFIGLIVVLPIFLITTVAILLEDGGPVFYKQERVGRNKKKFYIYKFRSMKRNAEQIHEEMRRQYGCTDISFKVKDDPRITRVGKVIRKFNIDELPQLINILKGDMSIVGPRPLPTYEFIDEQKAYGGKYDERYMVPQGLTCYWQISGRSEVDFADRMQLDVNYVREKNLVIDVKLIFLTFTYTIIGKAAY